MDDIVLRIIHANCHWLGLPQYEKTCTLWQNYGLVCQAQCVRSSLSKKK